MPLLQNGPESQLIRAFGNRFFVMVLGFNWHIGHQIYEQNSCSLYQEKTKRRTTNMHSKQQLEAAIAPLASVISLSKLVASGQIAP
mmetsp:Transcript_37899/g.80532  ORF Transcript_37899/g.80532 Transcript_37899/m.80532 type:complete len:86 (-) Transcript_37899:1265-1522(-)